MKNNDIYNEIVEFCKKNQNPQLVEKYKRYFKEGVYDAWGVETNTFKQKCKEMISEHNVTPSKMIEIAPLLFKSGKYEETSFVLEIIRVSPKLYDLELFKNIETLFEIGINNWAHADTLGMMILPVFVKKNIVKIEDFESWLKSSFKFQRRTAPVTLIKSLKTLDDFSDLFDMLEPLMSDSEREVHQGMGWFLREAWKIKPTQTESFLLKWKNSAPRLIFQYACEKMDKEKKLRFKKDK